MNDNKPRRYIKNPVAIEAVQFTRHTPMRVLNEFTNHLVRLSDHDDQLYVYDKLHDTWVKFTYNDWIIKGLRGEFYPCEDTVFQESYRPEMFQDGEGTDPMVDIAMSVAKGNAILRGGK